MADCLKLLHFHLGSQITNIRHVKTALTEAARIYATWCTAVPGSKYLDVGGGLGVDYDGSQTDFASSVNYTLQEYCNDVVYHIQTVCDDAGVPIRTSSRRAGERWWPTTVRCCSTCWESSDTAAHEPVDQVSDDFATADSRSADTLDELNPRNVLESFHDAQQWLGHRHRPLFSTGHLSLENAVRRRTCSGPFAAGSADMIDGHGVCSGRT